MRRRERQRNVWCLKSTGVHRRNSAVAKMGRGKEKRREQVVAPAPGLSP